MRAIGWIQTNPLPFLADHLSSAEFTEKQLRAYFLKNDTFKRLLRGITFSLGLLCLFAADIWMMIFPILAITGSVLLTISFVLWLLLKLGIRVPTDQEYDAYVQAKAREHLLEALRKIGQDNLSDAQIDQILFMRGFVLEGTKNALNYRAQDILRKRGKDGIWRYSINIYTYFYPVDHQLAVFVFDINAVNKKDRRELVQEYFYTDVVAATTEDEQDEITVDGTAHPYRTQSFALRICDGNRISATFRSIPLDHEKLPIYDLPRDNVEKTIAQLRLLLRTNKH